MNCWNWTQLRVLQLLLCRCTRRSLLNTSKNPPMTVTTVPISPYHMTDRANKIKQPSRLSESFFPSPQGRLCCTRRLRLLSYIFILVYDEVSWTSFQIKACIVCMARFCSPLLWLKLFFFKISRLVVISRKPTVNRLLVNVQTVTLVVMRLQRRLAECYISKYYRCTFRRSFS